MTQLALYQQEKHAEHAAAAAACRTYATPRVVSDLADIMVVLDRAPPHIVLLDETRGTARVRSLAGGEWNVCLNLGADDPPTCSCGVPKVER